jgi:uncharacterized protein YjfI (DUF2170 family)
MLGEHDHYKTTTYGFQWGSLEVERAMSDKTYGHVLFIKTPYGHLQVKVSPTGRSVLVSDFLRGSNKAKDE